MIDRFELLWRRIRRRLSRSEWAIQLLRLSKSEQTEAAPGLVMIQIDGLSHSQFEKALKDGRLPFLRRLIEKEHYGARVMYSGLPSSTPAVQGELFYGVKGIVPAFSYYDRELGRVVRMFEPEASSTVERRLLKQGPSLLAGGSSYSNIYGGEAVESRFCSSTFGWGALFRTAHPLALPFLLVSNIYSFIRIAVLLAVELVLAVIDFIRGGIEGFDFRTEFKFVPTRVAICILLRELITIGAKIDIARGLPIVHLNFLGYDEQAHRRSPTSRFAHWALKGIDDAISRIWYAARGASRRDYDIWIYSDHGQEATIPYPVENGRTIHEAVAELLDQPALQRGMPEPDRLGIQAERSRLLGGSAARRRERADVQRTPSGQAPGFTLTAMGPLGHLYLDHGPTPEAARLLARELVGKANVPLVLVPGNHGGVTAWTAAGEFSLPSQASEILGADHPFLEEVAIDLAALCHHPDAGDLILSGWRRGKKPVSFPMENGAHCGPGSEETKAFAVLPNDAPIDLEGRDYLRPGVLRHAALRFLDREPYPFEIISRSGPEEARTLRIMTYNVHSCIGMDGKLSPERIARVIARYSPDVVALQELDVGRTRTGGADQTEIVARLLRMKFHFHPALRVEEELYGDAILTRFPMRLVRAGELPNVNGKRKREPRGALWTALDLGPTEVHVLNTHLGLSAKERGLQVDALLGEEWLGRPGLVSPMILCGDFNALPATSVCRRLRGRLDDAQIKLDGHRPRSTWFGRYPFGRIDHVFVSDGIEVLGVEVPRTHLTRVASDHLPLIVDLRVEG